MGLGGCSALLGAAPQAALTESALFPSFCSSLACGTLPLLIWSHIAPCLLCRPVCFTAESSLCAGEGGHLQSGPQTFFLLFSTLSAQTLSNESNLGSLQLPELPSLSALTQCCGKCHSTKVICKGKGGRRALPVPLLSECKGVDLFFNCLDPHFRLTEAELYSQCLLLGVAKLV